MQVETTLHAMPRAESPPIVDAPLCGGDGDYGDYGDEEPFVVARRLDGTYECTFCGGATRTPLKAFYFVLASRLRFVEDRLAKGVFCTAECLLAVAHDALGPPATLCRDLGASMEAALQRRVFAAALFAHSGSTEQRRAIMLAAARQPLEPHERDRASSEDATHCTVEGGGSGGTWRSCGVSRSAMDDLAGSEHALPPSRKRNALEIAASMCDDADADNEVDCPRTPPTADALEMYSLQ